MRSDLLVTAFTLCILTAAAPISDSVYTAKIKARSAEPIGRGSGGTGTDPHPINHNHGNRISSREAEPIGRGSGGAGTDPHPINHNHGNRISSREAEPIFRANYRSVGHEDSEEDIRNQGGKRFAEPEPVAGPVKSQRRADEDEDMVEARAIRNQGRAPGLSHSKNGRDTEAEAEPEPVVGHVKNQRNFRPVKGGGRPGTDQRRADDQSYSKASSAIRNQGGKRAVRGSNKRDAEVESITPDDDSYSQDAPEKRGTVRGSN